MSNSVFVETIRALVMQKEIDEQNRKRRTKMEHKKASSSDIIYLRIG